MSLLAKRLGAAISDNARKRLSALRAYPTLDSWRNPLTRGVARHFAHESWLNALKEIDFEYRLTDLEISDVPCLHYETKSTRPQHDVILYVHGGGFVAGSPRVNASMILPTCELSGIEAIGVDYALLPEAHFPVALDQVDSVYRALLDENENRRIFVFGDSAGGGIVLSNLMRWRREKLKLPAGAIFISPALDGAGASDTHITVDGIDPLIKCQSGKGIRQLFEYYAPGMDLKDPRISPLYGDFEGLPPILIHAGTREVCLGDAARLSEIARRRGVPVSLRVFDGMFHLFHMHWSLIEAKHAHEDIAAFITGNS